mmetsp:Transcript_47067/g.56922  ORF Transcript_47067/g.56922 Transcript_47067/m.56922 type:complete len:80 (-) Transcript_47067:32-271(-)
MLTIVSVLRWMRDNNGCPTCHGMFLLSLSLPRTARSMVVLSSFTSKTMIHFHSDGIVDPHQRIVSHTLPPSCILSIVQG